MAGPRDTLLPASRGRHWLAQKMTLERSSLGENVDSSPPCQERAQTQSYDPTGAQEDTSSQNRNNKQKAEGGGEQKKTPKGNLFILKRWVKKTIQGSCKP